MATVTTTDLAAVAAALNKVWGISDGQFEGEIKPQTDVEKAIAEIVRLHNV